MCEFFSCIVRKDGTVLWKNKAGNLFTDDSHETIVDEYELDVNNGETKTYVRIEVNPKDNDIFNHNIKNWNVKIDEHTIPAWYERQQKTLYEKNIYKALKECFKKCFLIKQIGIELSDGSWFVEDSKISKIEKQALIRVLKSSTVQEMWDSSTVQEMRDSSTVQKMWDSSTVQKMWDSSTVQEMWDSSTVRKMWDSSTVQKMWDSSTVQKMRDSSTVQEMWDSSTVRKMWDSSTVQKMWDSSTVQEMWDSSTAITSTYSNIKPAKKSGNAIFIDRMNKVIMVGKKKVKF